MYDLNEYDVSISIGLREVSRWNFKICKKSTTLVTQVQAQFVVSKQENSCHQVFQWLHPGTMGLTGEDEFGD